jgi:hypothetical protein
LRIFVARDLGRTEHVRPGGGRIVDADYANGPDVLVDEAGVGRAEVAL